MQDEVAIVALGGAWLALNAMSAWTMFALVALAMAAYAAACALSLATAKWGK